MSNNSPSSLTAMQASVLGVVRGSQTPVGAYHIIGELKAVKANLAPPTVYRSLRHLIDAGLVHRIESMNAYVACSGCEHDTPALFSICDDCGHTDEFFDENVIQSLHKLTDQQGFTPHRPVIEVHGICGRCRTARDEGTD